MATDDVSILYEAWRSRQPRPDLVRFTAERRRLISARLRLGYSLTDLLALVRYMYESDDDRPRFCRGENDEGRTYLDLENLLRVSKLGERVPLALAWLEGVDGGGGGDGGGSGGAPPVARSARRPAPAQAREGEDEGGGRHAGMRSKVRR